MGFFASGTAENARIAKGGPSKEFLHKLECRACPLNHARLQSPKMKPTGDPECDFYIIGEAPGEDEDYEGKQFVGKSGEILRPRLPNRIRDRVRYNNTIRCRPPNNRDPEPIEVECCRPSIERDIAQARPRAILGFGNAPLQWAIGQTGITRWRGRVIPVVIGGHPCWYFPIEHPASILRKRNRWATRPKDIGSEAERMYVFDIENAVRLVDELPDPVVHTRDDVFKGITTVDGTSRGDAQLIADYLREAADCPLTGLDFETIGLRPYWRESRILSIAVATERESLAFPFDHPRAPWSPRDQEMIREAFTYYLSSPRTLKAVHHLAFEMEWVAVFFGKNLLRAGPWGDTLSQAFVLDERSGRRELSLGFLTLENFGVNIKDLSSVNTQHPEDEPLSALLPYNAVDAKYHRALFPVQERKLNQERLLEQYELQVRRIPTVVLTQVKGIPVDQDLAKEFSHQFGKEIAAITDELRDLPVVQQWEREHNKTFSPSNNDDISYILRNYLHANITSTDSSVLDKIDHDFPRLVLDYRERAKLKSTYVDCLLPDSPKRIIYPDGLLHPILNTTETETTRLSSEDPNEQNWPKRKHREIRRQIAVPRGEVIAAFDYGQIQARNIAMESLDPFLVKALWERYDIHTEWTEKLAYAYPERVGGKRYLKDKKALKTFRDDVKNQWTFPLFFGAQLESVAAYLKIPPEVIKPLYDEYWDTFEGVLRWQNRLIKSYEDRGYVENLSGRRRRGPLSKNQIINSPIQADEAEIVCDAMNRLSETELWVLQPMMAIHDDLTFRLTERELEDHAETIIREMLACPFTWAQSVPITVELSVGTDWESLAPVETFASDTFRRVA
jgi:uracil-DNA glycosylase family 4